MSIIIVGIGDAEFDGNNCSLLIIIQYCAVDRKCIF